MTVTEGIIFSDFYTPTAIRMVYTVAMSSWRFYEQSHPKNFPRNTLIRKKANETNVSG